MPRGNGTTFDHQKLKKICKDYVELQDVGDVIDTVDFSMYLSTIPISQFCRKPGRPVKSNPRIKWGYLVRSKAYYSQIMAALDNVMRITLSGRILLVKTNEDAQFECWVCSETYDLRKRKSSRLDISTCSRKCASEYVRLTTI